MKCEWILCPVCGSKTRNKIRKDTVLENYPLYCPKCRQERLINVYFCEKPIIDFFQNAEYEKELQYYGINEKDFIKTDI